MATKLISLSSDRNFERLPAGQPFYRPELNGKPETPLTLEMRRSQELLDKQLKTRKRKLRVLREALQGRPIDELATHYATNNPKIRVWMSEMLQLLFFRAKDRTGLTELPKGPLAALPQAAFWLQKLNENEDVMLELNPAKLPSTQIAHDNMAPIPARPVYSRSISNSR